MLMSRRLLPVLAVVATAVGAPAAAAATAPGLGTDTGDHPQSSSCPSGSALVGVTAAQAPLFGMTIVGRMHAICAPTPSIASPAVVDDHVGNLGSRLAPPRTHAARLRCPAGQVVTALTGRSGDLVDRVGLRCQMLGPDGRPAAASTLTAQAGGHGGHARTSRACPQGTVAIGLRGDVRAGKANVLDFVALDCSTPA